MENEFLGADTRDGDAVFCQRQKAFRCAAIASF